MSILSSHPALPQLAHSRRWTLGQCIGAGLLAIIALGVLLGPLCIDSDPARQHLERFLQAPSLAEPLGYDPLGRSMLARLLHGSRLSLSLALLSVLSAAIPGTLAGLLAAWCGGWCERLLAALADAVLALPGLLLVLLLAAFAPGGFWPLYVGLALALWVESSAWCGRPAAFCWPVPRSRQRGCWASVVCTSCAGICCRPCCRACGR